MKFNDLIILCIQIIASLMMGWDYFTTKSYRRKINKDLSKYFSNLKEKINDDIKKSISNIKAKDILLGLLRFLICGIIIYITSMLPIEFSFNPFVMLLTGLTIIYMSFSGVMLIMKNIIPIFVSIGFGGPIHSVARFLLTTSKGPLAGLGFILLLISFLMRYTNYLAH